MMMSEMKRVYCVYSDEGRGLRLSRRYWGDEMSSCIEIYCLHLLNSASYLQCLQNYCPDAVVAVLPKRQAADQELPSSVVTLAQGDNIQDQVVACPGGDRQRSKYCVGFVCIQVFAGVTSLDVATSRCALLTCVEGGGETAYPRCVVDECC